MSNCNCGLYSCRTCKGQKISSFSTDGVLSSSTLFTGVNGSGNASQNVNFSLQQIGNYLMLGSVTVDWGEIDGTLSNQTDLQATLDDKAAVDGATMINGTFNGVALDSTGLPTAFLAQDGNYYTGTSSVNWGGITGTLSTQSDLQAALDAKEDITNFVLKTTDFTITGSRANLDVDATLGDVTIYLPVLPTHGHYIIRRINSTGGNVIIDAGTAGETINGASTFTITGSSTPNAVNVYACTSEFGVV